MKEHAMSDYLLSLIRTVVPVAVGSALGWLATHGMSLDPNTQAGLIAAITGLCIALYYAAIRWLESKHPAIGKWLLGAGAGKTPVYAAPEATVRVNGVTKRSPADDPPPNPPEPGSHRLTEERGGI
jgi:hypothetical protein